MLRCEAAAIGYPQSDIGAPQFGVDALPGAAGMLECVVQRFLDDAIDADLQGARDMLRQIAEFDVDPGAGQVFMALGGEPDGLRTRDRRSPARPDPPKEHAIRG